MQWPMVAVWKRSSPIERGRLQSQPETDKQQVCQPACYTTTFFLHIF